MNKFILIALFGVIGFVIAMIIGGVLLYLYYKEKNKGQYNDFNEWMNSDDCKRVESKVWIIALIVGYIIAFPVLKTSLGLFYGGNVPKMTQKTESTKLNNEWKIKVGDKECVGLQGKKTAVAILGVYDESTSTNRKNLKIEVIVKNLSSESISVDEGDFQLQDIEHNTYDLDGNSGIKIQPMDTKQYAMRVELPKKLDISQTILRCRGALTGWGEDTYEIRLNNITLEKTENTESKQKDESKQVTGTLIEVLDSVCGSFDSNVLDNKAFNEQRTPAGERAIPYLKEVNQRVKTTIDWNSNTTGIQQKVKYKIWRTYKADERSYQVDVDIHMGENGVSLKNITVRKVGDNQFKVDLETLALAFLNAGV